MLDLVSPCVLPDYVSVLGKRLVIALIATLPQNAIKIPAEIVKQRSQVQDELGSWEIAIGYRYDSTNHINTYMFIIF